ncbi:hypothetical protein N7492_000633 [Penicillium capsulatum]|uniref:Uncharacterized protein n=1 Tax=Penicillium capsulatum TaxID=69766 RepID=A0A9W9IS48_9EURO|nr:hypothetical protein N7492_000633 [Penicillium capsulatum]KAJ6130309.1 hypothetical protein N7512_003089 [Penicillium capsulatum]
MSVSLSTFPSGWDGAPSPPTAVFGSSLSSPTPREVANSFQLRNAEPTPSKPSAGEDEQPVPTTFVTPSLPDLQPRDAEPTLATQATLGSMPDICTDYTYAYHTKMILTPGVFRLKPDKKSGWGPMDSVWNMTVSKSAKLVNVKASCQGSGCTEINGKANKMNDGLVKQRKDGSWYMKVTRNMQESLMISGELVAGKDDPNHNHTMEVRASPNCDVPVAKNCTAKNFYNNQEQWKAYRVNSHITNYTQRASSFNDYAELLFDDLLSTTDKENMDCDIRREMKCDAPDYDDCKDNPSKTLIRRRMMLDAYVQFASFMRVLYTSVEEVAASIDTYLDTIVHNIWKKAVDKAWTGITAILSAAVGLLIAGAVFLQFLLPTTGPLAALGAGLVVGTIAGSNMLGLAGNIGSYESDPSTEDTEKKKAQQYTQQALAQLNNTKKAIGDSMESKETGSQGLFGMFKDGIWVSDAVRSILKKDDLKTRLSDWYRRQMIAQYITKALNDNSAYILFLGYGPDVKYGKEKIWGSNGAPGFTQADCKKYFKDNSDWKFATTCDVPLGPKGPPGMAVIVRPETDSVKGESIETDEWFEQPVESNGHKISAKDILASSMHGQWEHGFNHTLLNVDWDNVLSHGGVQAVKNMLMNTDPAQAGLYTVPVCEIDNLGYLPLNWKAMKKWLGRKHYGDWPSAKGPCNCRDYWVQPEGGKKKYFKDFVTNDVLDTINDCHMRAAAKPFKVGIPP